MCGLPAVIGMASSAASFIAEQQATAAYNANARAAHRDASIAAGYKYMDEGRRFAFDAKQLQQEGYDLAIESREAVGTGMASAGSAGVQGLTLGSLLSNTLQKSAENTSRLDTKREDLDLAYDSNVKSYEAEARSTINSMPLRAGPSILGLGINMASSFADKSNGGFNLKF